VIPLTRYGFAVFLSGGKKCGNIGGTTHALTDPVAR
jgi:hypothetical protein